MMDTGFTVEEIKTRIDVLQGMAETGPEYATAVSGDSIARYKRGITPQAHYLVEMRDRYGSSEWFSAWGFEHEAEARWFTDLKNLSAGWMQFRVVTLSNARIL